MPTATTRSTDQEVVLLAQLRDIYDAYRGAQLTRRYYEGRLAQLTAGATARPSGLLALGVTAGMMILAYVFPQFSVAYIAIMFLLVWNASRTKPADPAIPRYAAIASAFHAHAIALSEVVNKVHNTHDLPHELLAVYTAARRQIAEMELQLDPTVDSTLLNECFDKVNREIGARGLWIPRVAANTEVLGMSMEAAIHQTRMGGQVAITPRVGVEPPVPWPAPGS